MKTIKILLWSAFGTIGMLIPTFASTLADHDCVSINRDIELMIKLKDSGELRFANKVDEQQLPKFNFSKAEPFAEYLAYAKALIAAKKPTANQPCPISTQTSTLLTEQSGNQKITLVKDLVTPFELKQKNNHKVVVLIHGLTDSPFSFHDLAAFYYQQGFNVRTLLLPGHGTAPSDLLDISYRDWQQATDYIIERSLLDFEQVYLGGFSTGGALIFDYLMQKTQVNNKIKALFMWSPASKAKSDLAWLAGWVDYLPFVDWVDKDADIDFAKYESFPYNAGAQVHKLMSKIVGDNARDNNNFHNTPLFVVASDVDNTIETSATITLVNQWQKAGNAKAHFLYFSNDKDNPLNLASGVKLIRPECSSALCQSVIDIAHTATTNDHSNPHYGAQGSYKNCGHYLQDEHQLKKCKLAKNNILAEATAENLAKYPALQRITFNPYFEQMLIAINEFMVETER